MGRFGGDGESGEGDVLFACGTVMACTMTLPPSTAIRMEPRRRREAAVSGIRGEAEAGLEESCNQKTPRKKKNSPHWEASKDRRLAGLKK